MYCFQSFDRSYIDNPGPMVVFATPGMLHAGKHRQSWKPKVRLPVVCRISEGRSQIPDILQILRRSSDSVMFCSRFLGSTSGYPPDGRSVWGVRSQLRWTYVDQILGSPFSLIGWSIFLSALNVLVLAFKFRSFA